MSSNSYRYIDFLPKFVKAYNDTLRKTSGMAPSQMTDAYVLKKGVGWRPSANVFESRRPSFL